MNRLFLAATVLVSLAAFAPADDPKPADDKKSSSSSSSTPTTDKSDAIVMSSHVGNLTGQVSKVEKGSITLKVPEVVVTGITRRRTGTHGGSTAVPKYGTKTVELTYPISDKVVVKTVSGKDVDMSAVTTGETVEIHLDKVKEGKVGEPLQSHVEVKRIDVPNATTPKK